MNLRTLFAVTVLWVAAPAHASDAGTDAGRDDTPDASAGNGGADQMTQESDDDMSNTTCSLSRDCERGFTCENGMCRYVGYRQADQGCSAAPGLALGAAALTALTALGTRRRRRRR
jgi:hypothetical protein